QRIAAPPPGFHLALNPGYGKAPCGRTALTMGPRNRGDDAGRPGVSSLSDGSRTWGILRLRSSSGGPSSPGSDSRRRWISSTATAPLASATPSIKALGAPHGLVLSPA